MEHSAAGVKMHTTALLETHRQDAWPSSLWTVLAEHGGSPTAGRLQTQVPAGHTAGPVPCGSLGLLPAHGPRVRVLPAASRPPVQVAVSLGMLGPHPGCNTWPVPASLGGALAGQHRRAIPWPPLPPPGPPPT